MLYVTPKYTLNLVPWTQKITCNSFRGVDDVHLFSVSSFVTHQYFLMRPSKRNGLCMYAPVQIHMHGMCSRLLGLPTTVPSFAPTPQPTRINGGDMATRDVL